MTKQRVNSKQTFIPVFIEKADGRVIVLWRGRLGNGAETSHDVTRIIRQWASDPAAAILTNITFRYW